MPIGQVGLKNSSLRLSSRLCEVESSNKSIQQMNLISYHSVISTLEICVFWFSVLGTEMRSSLSSKALRLKMTFEDNYQRVSHTNSWLARFLYTEAD